MYSCESGIKQRVKAEKAAGIDMAFDPSYS